MLILPALAAFPAAARAGDYGPTSRGTVAISITIPPRVLITAPRAGADSRPLCIASSGLGAYHVAIVPGGAAPDALPSKPLLMAPGAPGAHCAGLPGGGAIQRLASVAGASSTPGQATLLIVPD